MQSAPGSSASWTAAPEGSELARAMAEAAAEEEGQGLPVCMVCKEGYATMPERLLAAYVFCSRLSCAQCPECVPSGTSSSQQVCCRPVLSTSIYAMHLRTGLSGQVH